MASTIDELSENLNIEKFIEKTPDKPIQNLSKNVNMRIKQMRFYIDKISEISYEKQMQDKIDENLS